MNRTHHGSVLLAVLLAVSWFHADGQAPRALAVHIDASWAQPLDTGGDAGFAVRVWQLGLPPGAQSLDTLIPGELLWAEAALQGLAGETTADPSSFAAGGIYYEGSAINYQTPGAYGTPVPEGVFPGDVPVPGLPGTARASTNNVVVEVRCFAEFPEAGEYGLEVRTETPFAFMLGHDPLPLPLEILSPASLAGPMAAVPSARDAVHGPGAFGPLPVPPLEAETVAAHGTSTSASADQGCGEGLANAAAVSGKVAVVRRGGCTFLEKVENAAKAGAVAVIVVNDRGDFPIAMGAPPNALAIPALMVSQPDGERLLNAGAARVRLSGGGTVLGAQWVPSDEGNRVVTLGITQPGIYPLRLLWESPAAPAWLEWSWVEADDQRRLLNLPADALPRIYRSLTETLPVVALIAVQGTWVVRYSGVLQSAEDIAGPYQDVEGAARSGDWVVDPLAARRFFRARR